MPLPPGLDDKTFQRALTRFKSVAGDAWVFTSAEDLALYKDALLAALERARREGRLGRGRAGLRGAGPARS